MSDSRTHKSMYIKSTPAKLEEVYGTGHSFMERCDMQITWLESSEHCVRLSEDLSKIDGKKAHEVSFFRPLMTHEEQDALS